MKFKIKIDETEHQVDASADGTVTIDGRPFKAEITGSGSDKRTVRVGDDAFEVRILRQGDAEAGDPGEYVLEVAGERVPLTVADLVKGASTVAVDPAGGATGTEAGGQAKEVPKAAVETPTEVKDGIWAPVPGKIVDVRVKAGDPVKEGDLLVILEAMKMENELHASKQATVAAVPVKKGDQVEKGQLLVAFD